MSDEAPQGQGELAGTDGDNRITPESFREIDELYSASMARASAERTVQKELKDRLKKAGIQKGAYMAFRKRREWLESDVDVATFDEQVRYMCEMANIQPQLSGLDSGEEDAPEEAAPVH